jgi:hypothetical protein
MFVIPQFGYCSFLGGVVCSITTVPFDPMGRLKPSDLTMRCFRRLFAAIEEAVWYYLPMGLPP